MNTTSQQLGEIRVRRLSGIEGGQPILISDKEVELLGQLKHALDTDDVKMEKGIAKQLRKARKLREVITQ